MSMMTDSPLILNHPRAWLLSGTHATLAAALAALQPQLAAADPLPSLNQSAFASLPALSGRLVTFDAMVQDTSLAPQIYPLSYTTDGTASSVGSGFFLDQLPPPILDPRTRITQYGDRQPVYLVSVPDEATPVPADRVMPGTDKNKYPLPGVGHQACVAKYYPASTRLPATAAVGGSSEPAAAIELPALGSVVTVTGILEWSGHAEDDDGHQVPTIHVLFSSAHVPAATLPAEISLPDLRTCLINHLAARFFQNDRLAAELVLLHILHTPPPSRATNSTSAAAAADELSWPHSLPLTLIVPPTDTWIGSRDWLSDLGTLLAIPATSLSLTQSTLSTSTFAPRATSLDTTTDTDEEGICAGRLQLAASSLLLVSDRDLEPGQLGDKAVRNLQVLHKVLKTHTLPYVFPYTEVAVPAAYAKVVVTDALGGEVVPRGVRVVVEPTDAAAAAVDEVDEEVVRAYVAHVRASNECKMPQPDQDVDKVQAAVEAAYVADRRKTTAADNANTPVDGPEALDGSAGPAQLHWQLALARRVGRSRGKASVGIDEWEWARKMDAERRERVRKVKKGHKVLGVQAGVEGAGEEPRR